MPKLASRPSSRKRATRNDLDGRAAARSTAAVHRRVKGSEESGIGPATYEAIRHDVVTLALTPGEKVSEVDLGRRYNVGKAPVRMALARLAQEGLVINRLRSGHIVAPITLQNITEIYQLRRTLESAAASLAAGRTSDALSAAYERTRKADFDGKSAELVFKFLTANRDFIVEMAKCTGNQLMVQWVSHLEDLAMRILFLGARTQQSAAEWRFEYQAIYEALTRNEADTARRLVSEAVDHSEQIVLRALMQDPDLRSVNLGSSAAG